MEVASELRESGRPAVVYLVTPDQERDMSVASRLKAYSPPASVSISAMKVSGLWGNHSVMTKVGSSELGVREECQF